MTCSNEILSLITSYFSIEDLYTFAFINKKCNSILTNRKTNINCGGATTKKEFLLLPNAKVITGELYSIVFSLCVSKEDEKLSDDEFWKNVETRWKEQSTKYEFFNITCFSGIDAHTIPLLKVIAPKIISLSIHTEILPCGLCIELLGAIHEMKHLNQIRIDGVTLTALYNSTTIIDLSFNSIILDSINMKRDSAALMSLSKQFLKSHGIIHIDNCRDNNDVEIIKKILPNFIIGVDYTADKSVFELIASKKLITIPCYHSPFAFPVPEEPSSEVIEQINKINDLYLPTIQQSLPEKLFDAYGLIVIGRLPAPIVSDHLAFLRYNNIQPEIIPLDLSLITTLTRLELRMNKPRTEVIKLPHSLRVLDLEIQDNLDGFCVVDDKKGIKELTHLTHLEVKFSDTQSLTLPTSLVSCSLAMCPCLKTIGLEGVNSLTRLEVQACESLGDMKLPSSMKLALFQMCPKIHSLEVPSCLKSLQHVFDPTINLSYF
ncbi:hypothetical protein KM1_020800 [Entamoeba histolytica HM-3:IMSS]|uniref:F-box domain-containing protein n=5 Tax=Entamoeba histolytica TaxID=5759 RepID=C4LUY5_ENTH1|nr:hypothetical protein EHI_092200 [Entamoeba histolytica HM-1:IMSS]EMD47025.1 Hypothetical protein EHI5A_020290 [Entamoeba histolytica KU27]EMS17606.1 hypothetical protein KM1_020800 [Entamoeba histolytica HM-3:IMSS]ENY61817.1 hypothetical protein EHI7A_008440 [Entamoeba histolytica HM-1:IMSS-A]GAT92453.1 hypothetical protein CL6EHI_092200 [Entamoeba histolytica]EAL49184.1 hypothetical protein EHI_092200 [Entamoeba histolytica HM-1:IMSS]|eukprot:XP_654572.1 hypothetical protein EHI_092200 [Entamoeba histolytica HM-1:IMSS]